ncbi:rhomboid family intramembrane serine protease [Luteolibacter marinus]|uniref:rhomboid family intramembrane serine protease n=1 Tax=Luteolibacter marinus TaxID=2776705 RepID=UPI001865DD94|nr:rhomboid family intramembrane serine protease [Luteolibacter marinus]
MGTADRDYFRDEERRYTQMDRQTVPPVTKFLLISNLVIYFVDMLFLKYTITNWGAFTIESGLMQGRIWELITFQFLHGSPGHVILNCVGIYVFGPFVERWWGSRKFTAFYLACGVAGALFFTLLTVTGILPHRGDYPAIQNPLVGASAGIYGMLVCVAVMAPKTMVRLLIPPISMTMRTLCIAVIGIAVAVILGDILLGGSWFENSGGEAGHLGGAILGYFLSKHPQLLGSNRERKIIRPAEFKRRGAPKLRPRTEVDVAGDSEVDRILDKIAHDGLQSLSDEERETLQRAAKAFDEK